MARPIITLTTDYGTADHLVGSMKGVILGMNPEAEIVDITHSVAPYDVLDAALTINQASRYFPNRTIHIVVVDPGVGTARRPLLVSAGTQFYIAPDNGVLSLVYEREKESVTVRHITAEHYFLRPISNTFHGRDIFAPVGGALSKTWQTASFGDAIEDFTRLTLPKPKVTGNVVKGIVLRVDAFGNLVTNLTPEDVPSLSPGNGKVKVIVGNKEVAKVAKTFADGAPGEPIALIGSSGFLEFAVNKGDAAKALSANRGAEVTVELK
ncbi:MAG: SAM-dependent chlorinase/fluorinase [Candidatus Acidiferrales bacterium]